MEITDSRPLAIAAVESENEELKNRGMVTLSLRMKCELNGDFFTLPNCFDGRLRL